FDLAMFQFEYIARLGQPVKLAQQVAGKRGGFFVVVVQSIDVQNLLQVTQIGSAIDHPASFAQLHNVGCFVFVRKFSGDCFEHVHRGNQSFDRTEFVGDYDQLAATFLERLDQRQDVDGF